MRKYKHSSWYFSLKWLMSLLLWYLLIAIIYHPEAYSEMGYFKARTDTVTTETTSKEIDYITKTPVLDEEGKETGELRDVAVYKDVLTIDTKEVLVIDEKASGAALMSGTSPSPAWMGRDLREVVEIKAEGSQAVILRETRIGRWTKDDPPIFNRITPLQWKAEGFPEIALNEDGTKMIHPWRKPSGIGPFKGPTYEQVLEAIK